MSYVTAKVEEVIKEIERHVHDIKIDLREELSNDRVEVIVQFHNLSKQSIIEQGIAYLLEKLLENRYRHVQLLLRYKENKISYVFTHFRLKDEIAITVKKLMNDFMTYSSNYRGYGMRTIAPLDYYGLTTTTTGTSTSTGTSITITKQVKNKKKLLLLK